MLVKEYLANGGSYAGHTNKNEGLKRWFAEKWTNQRGETGYKFTSDVYRPNIKVSKNTPVTFSELI